MACRPVIGPNEAVPVVQHHAIQVLVLSVEAHLNVTSEFWVALWPVGLLDLVTQQACHAFHLDLLLPDENLQQFPRPQLCCHGRPARSNAASQDNNQLHCQSDPITSPWCCCPLVPSSGTIVDQARFVEQNLFTCSRAAAHVLLRKMLLHATYMCS